MDGLNPVYIKYELWKITLIKLDLQNHIINDVKNAIYQKLNCRITELMFTSHIYKTM